MIFLTAYLSGFKTIFQTGKLWLLLYVLNFLFALLLAYPLSGFLSDKLGHTLAADKLLEGFDFTVANDFMQEYGDSLGLVLNQSVLALLLYLLLSVFTVGGILTVYKQKENTFHFATFWTGASNYFWRILRLTIYFLLIQIGLFFLFFMLFSTLTAGGLERFQNESEIIQRGLLLLPFYIFFSTLFFMIQDYAKIHIVEMDKGFIFQPVKQAIRWVFKNFLYAFPLYLLNLLTFAFLFFIYWKMDGGNAILFTFLLGQFFVFTRIGTKLLNLASATDLYHRIRT